MTCERRDRKPRWWLLYTTGLLLVGLLALVEILVPAGGLRGVLQVAVIMTGFGLMALWIRRNRVAMELEEYRQRRETVAHSRRIPSSVPSAEHNGSRMAWPLPSKSPRALGADAPTREVRCER